MAVTALRPGLDPVQGRNFNKRFLLGTWRLTGAEPQSLVSVTNIPGLNNKSLRSAYDVKAYLPLIAIPPQMGKLSLAVQLVVFERVG